MYHILIVGAGYVGSEIAKHYAAKKQKVWAVTRSQEKAEALKAAGVEPVIADLNKPETLTQIPSAHFIVICPAPDQRSDEAYENIYITGIANFLKTRELTGKPSLIVYLSSTGVWDTVHQGMIDETFLPEPQSKKAKMLYAAERQVLMSPYPSLIYRLSGIYGPGRNRIQKLQHGQWPSENLGRYMNVIHRDDIVHGVEILFSKGEAGEVYLGVDDYQATQYEFLIWLAAELGLQLPDEISRAKVEGSGKRLSNKKIKKLGWRPQYPDFKQGYQSFMN